MKIHHDIIPNTPEWLAYRREHDNGSEAAAMLGLSKTTTRTELLHAKHTGMEKEFSAYVQRNVLDYGHTIEALVRPLVEFMIADDLTPAVCSEGRLSASLDGMSEDHKTLLEVKQWNAEMAAQVAAGIMPEQHMPQCQQALLITGAEKVIFAVGDGTPENLLTIDVFPSQEWFERIRAGWVQFHADLAAYVPPAPAPVIVAATFESLPAVAVSVSGSLAVVSNLELFGSKLREFIAQAPAEPSTDQDFADIENATKILIDAEGKLKHAKESAIASVDAVEQMTRTADDFIKLASTTRLLWTKLVTARKLAIKQDMVQRANAELAGFIAGLNAEFGRAYMPTLTADFPGAIKGKSSFASIQNAVDTLLANTKATATTTASHIKTSLNLLGTLAADHASLFPDVATLVMKAPDDLTAIIKSRIADYQAKENARIEADRARIRREEQEKLAEQQAAQAIAQAASQPAPAPAPAAPAVIAAPAYTAPAFTHRPAADIDQPQAKPEMTLGTLNRRIAPVQVSTEGLRALGFAPAGNLRAAVLYRESDFEAICEAIEKHMRHTRQANRENA